MQIIILGAGQVGATLAETLSKEGHDITLVDIDAERLEELRAQLDIATIQGPGSYPMILRDAGAQSADLLIAVTSSDETNIVACQVAYTLYKTPTKIARIRSRHYQTHGELFDNHAMPVDVWISPEQIVTHFLKRIIESPGALQALDFANGRVSLIAVNAIEPGPFIGQEINLITKTISKNNFQIVAVFRKNQAIPLHELTKIQRLDEVFFIANKELISKVMQGFGHSTLSIKRVMIAGGGNIGASLAKLLESNYNLKLIERNESRTQKLVHELNNTTILVGDASDRELLLSENVEYLDVFCALTNNDEINIMSCLQAKHLGARYVIALVTKTAYVELLEAGSEIDIVLSPQQITVGSILKYIRRGDITNLYSLRRGAAEVIEIVAHGDHDTSKVVGRKTSELKLPYGAILVALVREGKAMIPTTNDLIAPNDKVILFLSEKKALRAVEKLFAVSATYI